MAKDDGVGDAHHGSFQVQGKQHVVGLGLVHLFAVEPAQLPDTHHGAVDNFARLEGNVGFQSRNRAVVAHKFDGAGPGLRRGNGLFCAVEVPAVHVGDAGLGHFRPVPHHPVGIPLAVLLNCGGRTTVGISFPDYRIDRAAQHPGIAQLDLALRVVGRFVGIVRDVVALLLKFRDGGLQLGNRGADVGQLYQVRRRLQAQLAAHAQVVGNPLFLGQVVGEVGDNAPRQGNVPSLQFNARTLGKGLENGQQGVGSQGRSLVSLRVNYLGGFCHLCLLSSSNLVAQNSRAAASRQTGINAGPALNELLKNCAFFYLLYGQSATAYIPKSRPAHYTMNIHR